MYSSGNPNLLIRDLINYEVKGYFCIYCLPVLVFDDLVEDIIVVSLKELSQVEKKKLQELEDGLTTNIYIYIWVCSCISTV